MNGFMILTTCLTNSDSFLNTIVFSEVERLAVEIESSVFNRSTNHTLPMCYAKTDKGVVCTRNASYNFNDCAQLQQSNVNSQTLYDSNTNETYDISFCDIELGCTHEP